MSIGSKIGETVIYLDYDDNGNMKQQKTVKNSVEEITTYSYNELNQLIEYINPKGETTTYAYYPDGLRKSKTTGTNTTAFYYDSSNVIIETENGNLNARNIWDINEIVYKAFIPLI